MPVDRRECSARERRALLAMHLVLIVLTVAGIAAVVLSSFRTP